MLGLLRLELFTLFCMILGGKLQIFAGTTQGLDSEKHWFTERTEAVVCMSEWKMCVCLWGGGVCVCVYK